MITVDWLKFFFQLIIAGMVLRILEMKLLDKNPNDPLGKALAFVY